MGGSMDARARLGGHRVRFRAIWVVRGLCLFSAVSFCLGAVQAQGARGFDGRGVRRMLRGGGQLNKGEGAKGNGEEGGESVAIEADTQSSGVNQLTKILDEKIRLNKQSSSATPPNPPISPPNPTKTQTKSKSKPWPSDTPRRAPRPYRRRILPRYTRPHPPPFRQGHPPPGSRGRFRLGPRDDRLRDDRIMGPVRRLIPSERLHRRAIEDREYNSYLRERERRVEEIRRLENRERELRMKEKDRLRERQDVGRIRDVETVREREAYIRSQQPARDRERPGFIRKEEAVSAVAKALGLRSDPGKAGPRGETVRDLKRERREENGAVSKDIESLKKGIRHLKKTGELQAKRFQAQIAQKDRQISMLIDTLGARTGNSLAEAKSLPVDPKATNKHQYLINVRRKDGTRAAQYKLGYQS
ncbi:hypothetical protein AAMO2058_001001300 [Amorphochlora amoebiformis]